MTTQIRLVTTRPPGGLHRPPPGPTRRQTLVGLAFTTLVVVAGIVTGALPPPSWPW